VPFIVCGLQFERRALVVIGLICVGVGVVLWLWALRSTEVD